MSAKANFRHSCLTLISLLPADGLRRTMQYDPTKGHSDGIRGTSLDRLIIWLATGKSVDVPSASAWH